MERQRFLAAAALAVVGLSAGPLRAQTPPAAAPARPDILVIFGADIGQSNISASSPSAIPASFSIDQIAKGVEAQIRANAAKAAPK